VSHRRWPCVRARSGHCQGCLPSPSAGGPGCSWHEAWFVSGWLQGHSHRGGVFFRSLTAQVEHLHVDSSLRRSRPRNPHLDLGGGPGDERPSATGGNIVRPFHSCPLGTGVVPRLGSSIGSSRGGTAGASGLFVPKPSCGASCQCRCTSGLGQTVRGCPLVSTADRGGCHSLCHSAARMCTM